jgi:hypothetical protein
MLETPKAHLPSFIHINDSDFLAKDVVMSALDGLSSSHENTSLMSVWLMSLACASLVGFVGVIPMIVLPKDVDSCKLFV